MSTRSFISVKQLDGTLTGCYCHYDGYPSHVGAILAQYFDSKIRALNLIEGTDIREMRVDGTIDRFNEGGQYVVPTVKDAFDGVYDYVYVFDDEWKCFSRDRHGIIQECSIPQPT